MREISEGRLKIGTCHPLCTGCKNININIKSGKNMSYIMVLPFEKLT